MWAEKSEKEQDRAEILVIGGMTTSRTTRHWYPQTDLPQSQPMNSTLEGLLFLESEGTRRTREEHWEQKKKAPHKNCEAVGATLGCVSTLLFMALFLHNVRQVLEKNSPPRELLRHKPQELEKCVP